MKVVNELILKTQIGNCTINASLIVQKLPLVIHANLLQNCFDKTGL